MQILGFPLIQGMKTRLMTPSRFALLTSLLCFSLSLNAEVLFFELPQTAEPLQEEEETYELLPCPIPVQEEVPVSEEPQTAAPPEEISAQPQEPPPPEVIEKAPEQVAVSESVLPKQPERAPTSPNKTEFTFDETPEESCSPSEAPVAKQPEQAPSSSNNTEISFPPEVIVDDVRGLVLLGKMSDVKESGWPQIDGVKIVDLNVPGDPKDLEKRLLPLFLHKNLTEQDIVNIKREIISYFKEQERPFVIVQVPEQDVTDGVIQMVVSESRLGKIAIKGNRWTKEDTLRQYLRLEPGEEINEGTLFEDVDFINRNPFRRTEIIYTPGEKPDTTDIELVTQDRCPIRFYTGVENTGLEDIGTNRWLAGFNWGNAFGLDQELSYQYTAAFQIHEFQAHTLRYTIPLAWRHLVTAYGGYSAVHSSQFETGMTTHGFATQISLRYEIPFRSTRSYTHELSVGGDFKRTNNNLEFTDSPGIPLFGHIVNLTQLVAGYNGAYESNWVRTTFIVEAFWSPGQWIADQTVADYQSLRVGSNPHYVYTRASLANIVRLPQEFSFSTLFQWQVSDRNLIPSEQLGIGGYNTVRGYEERQLNEDNGFIVSGEVRTPVIHLFKRLGKHKIADSLQFLAFMDYGYGTNHALIPGEPNFQYLWSVGPGLRYDIAPYLSVRADWGIKLYRDSYGGGATRLHFGVTASF